MRIGIVTPYDSANFGAYLQACASKLYLESLGHTVIFLKWRDEAARKSVFFKKGKGLRSRLTYMARRSFYKANYDNFNKALQQLQIADIHDPSLTLDAVIVGSDEIWNIRVRNFQNPALYGGFWNGKRFAYAPSCGNAAAEDFQAFPEYRELLKDIRIIGVRDERTQSLITDICGEKPKLVCDPTLLCTADQYPAEATLSVSGPYLLIYSYQVPEKHVSLLRQYAQKHQLKLAAVGLYQSWCDVNISCTPFEFISIVRNAAAVYTTTFHGSIFTFLNHKNCAIYPASPKVQDLIAWTGMDGCVVEADATYDTFSKRLEGTPDYEMFENRVNQRRAYSRKLYEDALKGEGI